MWPPDNIDNNEGTAGTQFAWLVDLDADGLLNLVGEPGSPEGDIVVSESLGVVGGLAEFPDVAQAPASQSTSSASSPAPYATLAGGAAVAALALVAGGWYARRRWLR